MTDIFSAVLNDASSIEQEYLGPDYEYHKKIKTPSQLGMGTRGSFQQIGKDISGLVDYVEVLVTGRSRAQTKSTPLGNRFFLKTGAQCKDASGKLQDRYVYVNNIPDGNIPLLSSALDTNFTEFEGLVPGAIEKMNDLNPMHFMRAFMAGSEPKCTNVTLSTVDVNDNASFESHHVADFDINDINPCVFKDKVNSLTKRKCREGFTNMSLRELQDILNIPISNKEYIKNKNYALNIAEKTYYVSLTGMLLYILYKLLK